MGGFWKNIWDDKGNSDSDDLLYLCGWEHLDIDVDSKQVVDGIVNIMNIKKGESVLEVACGAGFLSRNFQDFEYTGVDYSESLIKKHKNLFPTHNVVVSEASSLPFNSSSYNKVFCSGLFQYLPNIEYVNRTINEMKRVAIDSILIADLKTESNNDKHFIIEKEILKDDGFVFSDCIYCEDNSRYNAYLKLKG